MLCLLGYIKLLLLPKADGIGVELAPMEELADIYR